MKIYLEYSTNFLQLFRRNSNILKVAAFCLLMLAYGNASAQQQAFTTVGSTDFTVPANVLEITVEAIGAGGGGGRVTPANVFDTDAGGGGGGGAYSRGKATVTPGNIYPVVVGAGGTNTGTSVDGGDSYFNDGTVIKAEGGRTRSGNDNTAGVPGGQASNSLGDIKFSGGHGGNGNESAADGGGGGGAAGSAGTEVMAAGLRLVSGGPVIC